MRDVTLQIEVFSPVASIHFSISKLSTAELALLYHCSIESQDMIFRLEKDGKQLLYV